MRSACFLLALAIGCGGDEGGHPDGGSPQVDAGLPPGALRFTIEPFDVEPSSERQVCKVVNLPDDGPFEVASIVSNMVGTSHHLNVYKGIGAEETTAGDGVVRDCDPASEQFGSEAAYIFGAATPQRTMTTPEAVAFHLKPGQRLVLEQHVINSSETIMQGGATVDLVPPAPGAVIEHHAEVAWFAFWGIYLPPGEETSFTKSCTFPYDVTVFGLMSHTHQLGVHFSIEAWDGTAGDHLYESDDWSHPPYLELDPPRQFAAGTGLQWTCTYVNTNNHSVSAGPLSTDEMCMTFALYYPTDTLDADPTQCNLIF